MRAEYLRENKVFSFDKELTPEEILKFNNGQIHGTFERDFVEIPKKNEYQIAYELLTLDIEKGKTLIKEFLVDNRLSPNVTTADSIRLLQLFGTAKALAEVGDLKNVRLILSSLEINEIYTQERHDKYMSILS